jgi:hypothetical protein
LHVENLKGEDGELSLRVGDNKEFGLINVGDANELHKLCGRQAQLVASEKEIASPMFRTVNDKASPINVLIGSKKFSEGWNCWRVSTMGFMHVGKSEGSEVIQLFGRGVRLRGYGGGLKRSHFVEEAEPPAHLEILETLGIFGVQAAYMRQFREYLETEGLPANDAIEEIVLPITKTLPNRELHVPRLRPGSDFRRDRRITLAHSPRPLSEHRSRGYGGRTIDCDRY